MKAKRAALIEALTGRFDDHHAELARILLAQIDALTAQIDQLTTRIGELITAVPAAQGVDADGTTGPSRARPGRASASRRRAAGRDPRHLPDAAQVDHRRGRPGHDPVPYRRAPGVLGQAVPAHHPVRGPQPCRQDRQGQPLPQRRPRRRRRSSRQDQHLPRRTLPAVVKRRGKLKALVAVARTILVIIWHLLADPAARYDDLGDDYYISPIDTDRKIRSHIRQLEALRLHRRPHSGSLTSTDSRQPPARVRCRLHGRGG